jgi:DNA-binding transcriptional MerR regulator
MANSYSSVGEVATRLKVAYWRIKYAHAAGYIKEPLRVGNHRLYTEDDIHALELYFDQKKGGNEKVQLQRQGLLCLE